MYSAVAGEGWFCRTKKKKDVNGLILHPREGWYGLVRFCEYIRSSQGVHILRSGYIAQTYAPLSSRTHRISLSPNLWEIEAFFFGWFFSGESEIWEKTSWHPCSHRHIERGCILTNACTKDQRHWSWEVGKGTAEEKEVVLRVQKWCSCSPRCPRETEWYTWGACRVVLEEE